MEKEVNKILERLSMEVISLDEARAEMRILGLFNVVGRSEQLLAFKKWERDKCKLPWDASPEQIIEQYISQ